MSVDLELALYLEPCGKIPNLKKIGPETLLHLQLVAFLRNSTLDGSLKALWFHIANQGDYSSKHYNARYGSLLKNMGKHNGLPDLVISDHYSTVFIEIKNGKGKLSPPQKTFKKWCDSIGIPYEIVKCIEDLKKILTKNNFL